MSDRSNSAPTGNTVSRRHRMEQSDCGVWESRDASGSFKYRSWAFGRLQLIQILDGFMRLVNRFVIEVKEYFITRSNRAK